MQASSPFRRGNEAIARAAARLGSGEREIEFICECGDPACLASVPLTLTEFEQARNGSARPVAIAGHPPPP